MAFLTNPWSTIWKFMQYLNITTLPAWFANRIRMQIWREFEIGICSITTPFLPTEVPLLRLPLLRGKFMYRSRLRKNIIKLLHRCTVYLLPVKINTTWLVLFCQVWINPNLESSLMIHWHNPNGVAINWLNTNRVPINLLSCHPASRPENRLVLCRLQGQKESLRMA